MKRWKRTKSSYFSVLLRCFGAYTLFLVIAAIALLFWALMESSITVISLSDRDLSEYNDILQAEQYDQFPVRILLGKTGSIAVTDNTGRILYGKSHEDISPEALACIPLQGQYIYPTVTHWYDEQGRQMTLVASDGYSGIFHQTPVVLDADHKILYGSIPGVKTEVLSDEAYGYLTQTLPQGYYIWKYPFENADGQSRWLILYEQILRNEEYAHLDMIWSRTLLLFLGLYVLVLLAMALWLSRKVCGPLKRLEQGFTELAQQNDPEPIQCRGPREFEQICSAFNQLSAQLAESERQRKALEDNRQKLLADISHDLKTPITVIQGYAKAICDGLIPPEKLPDYLDTIYQKSNRLTGLIDTFHEYSKLEHPQFTLQTKRLDLCEVLREYLASKYNELELGGFVPEIEIPDEAIWCMLDKTAFLRVLENIVSNAIKHNPSGTALFFQLQCRNGQAMLTLADNGVGIPPELADRIFDPFVVGDESRNTRQGSGLGLAISHKIVTAHGGTIQLVQPPQPGYSTQFQVTLPLA